MSNEVERKKIQSAQNKMLLKNNLWRKRSALGNPNGRTKFPTVHFVQGLVACQK